jgi:hypothetical protein
MKGGRAGGREGGRAGMREGGGSDSLAVEGSSTDLKTLPPALPPSLPPFPTCATNCDGTKSQTAWPMEPRPPPRPPCPPPLPALSLSPPTSSSSSGRLRRHARAPRLFPGGGGLREGGREGGWEGGGGDDCAQ